MLNSYIEWPRNLCMRHKWRGARVQILPHHFISPPSPKTKNKSHVPASISASRIKSTYPGPLPETAVAISK